MFKILILENELITLECYKKIVKESFAGSHVYTATTEKEALMIADEHDLDLMLLDIELNDQMSGLDVAEQIKNMGHEIDFIVITADSKYLKESSRINPYYYFMKPIDELFLFRKLHEWEILKEKVKELDFSSLTLRLEDETIVVPLKHIYYFEKQNRDVRIRTFAKSYLVKGSIRETMSQLDYRFRISHQSYIINSTKISDIVFTENRNRIVRFRDISDEVPLSRYKAKEFLENLLEHEEL